MSFILPLFKISSHLRALLQAKFIFSSLGQLQVNIAYDWSYLKYSDLPVLSYTVLEFNYKNL